MRWRRRRGRRSPKQDDGRWTSDGRPVLRCQSLGDAPRASLLARLSRQRALAAAARRKTTPTTLKVRTRFVNKPKAESEFSVRGGERRKMKVGVYSLNGVTAGAHLPTPWLYEPANRPGDKADYCLDCGFLP